MSKEQILFLYKELIKAGLLSQDALGLSPEYTNLRRTHDELEKTGYEIAEELEERRMYT